MYAHIFARRLRGLALSLCAARRLTARTGPHHPQQTSVAARSQQTVQHPISSNQTQRGVQVV